MLSYLSSIRLTVGKSQPRTRQAAPDPQTSLKGTSYLTNFDADLAD